MFSEKLKILLYITNTKSVSLAKVLFIDPSYISKLINGRRKLSKRSKLVDKMCYYFSRKIQSKHQKFLLSDILKKDVMILNFDEVQSSIKSWLFNESEVDHKIFNSEFDDKIGTRLFQSPKQKISSNNNSEYYFGVSGKQKAVLKFLDRVLEEKSTQTLYLSSDESFDWIVEDKVYRKIWAKKLIQVLKAGNRIKIIHDMKRELDSMVSGISCWLPMYLTGMVESFYYNGIKDNVYKRTIFVAPKSVALVSSSIVDNSNQMLNELIFNKIAIKSFKTEILNYLELCTPLSNFLKHKNENDLLDSMDYILSENSDVKSIIGVPMLFTMPDDVSKSISSRTGCSNFYSFIKSLNYKFNKFIEKNTYVEIVRNFEEINCFNDIPIPFSEILGLSCTHYTKKEFQNHLKYIKKLSDKNNNYNVYFSKDIPSNILVWYKENQSLLISCSDKKSFIIKSSLNHLCNVFDLYFEEQIYSIKARI